jgi:hypothetical protein
MYGELNAAFILFMIFQMVFTFLPRFGGDNITACLL